MELVSYRSCDNRGLSQPNVPMSPPSPPHPAAKPGACVQRDLGLEGSLCLSAPLGSSIQRAAAHSCSHSSAWKHGLAGCCCSPTRGAPRCRLLWPALPSYEQCLTRRPGPLSRERAGHLCRAQAVPRQMYKRGGAEPRPRAR